LRLRLTKIDEYQFLTCLKNSLWGSQTARFKDWQIGDYLAIIVDKALAGLAQVSGKPFYSKERVWDNRPFPHRVPIRFTHILAKDQRIPILGEVRNALTSAWGPKYGWGILNQQVLTNDPANTIINAILSRPNSLTNFESNIEQLFQEAKQDREMQLIEKPRRIRKRKEISLPTEKFETEKEKNTHSLAQNTLIKLGRITGCSVWIAQNDRNRPFHGRPLGEECLKQLPNLGLNEEATRRISLIDIIWIKQNSPVCAFEVETTTSIYSGLLRMSDLLAVVPALNIKLYIVAPKERENKVRAELTRPTFQKVGLNDYCRFISIEELNILLSKVKGIGGYVQPAVVDTIAIGFEEEIRDLL